MTGDKRIDPVELMAHLDAELTDSHPVHAEFADTPPVIVPRSPAAVGDALRLARAANRRVVVRSGGRMSKVHAGDASAARVVVSMEMFDGVQLDGETLRVGPAASIADIADTLWSANLSLPLGDDPTRSFASVIMGDPRTLFPRSGSGTPSLRAQVASGDMVSITDASFGERVPAPDLLPVLEGGLDGVVTGIELLTRAFDPSEASRWSRIWVITYDAVGFPELCETLLDSSALSDAVDFSLSAASLGFAMSVIVVRASGVDPRLERPTADVIEGMMRRTGSVVLSEESTRGARACHKAWLETGPASIEVPGEAYARHTNLAPRAFSEFRADVLALVDHAAGVDEGENGEHEDRTPGLEAWVQVRLMEGGGVDATAHLATDGPKLSRTDEARELISRAVGSRASAHDVLRGMSALADVEPIAGFDLESVLPSQPTSAAIPKFRGRVHPRAAGGRRYRKKIIRKTRGRMKGHRGRVVRSEARWQRRHAASSSALQKYAGANGYEHN